MMNESRQQDYVDGDLFVWGVLISSTDRIDVTIFWSSNQENADDKRQQSICIYKYTSRDRNGEGSFMAQCNDPKHVICL